MKRLLKILILIKACSSDFSPSHPKCSEKKIIKQQKGFNDTNVVFTIFCRSPVSVNLKNVGITEVPIAKFHHSMKTREINFSENQIEDIHEDTFRGLFRVTKLDLSLNKITSVNSVMFSDLHQLKILNLSMNSLETITNIVLPRSIGVIDLAWNRLDNSKKNIFNSLTPFEVRHCELEYETQSNVYRMCGILI